jgi:mRNA interferase MazF
MDRGSVVLVSAKGEYGKTRPAVVVQSSRMESIVESVTVCFLQVIFPMNIESCASM